MLDKRDWEILKVLTSQGRVTWSELSKRVNLSAPAVAERVQRLEEQGIINGYRASIDLTKLGLPISTMIQLRLSGTTYEKAIAAIKAIPEIVECIHTTGSNCLTMVASLRDTTHLESVLQQLLPLGEPTTSLLLSNPVPRRLFKPDNP